MFNGAIAASRIRYCQELKTVVTRAKDLGYSIPNASTLSATNSFILALKSLGIWSISDFITNGAFNDTTLANFSLLNWKNPSGTSAVAFGGVTYNAQGYKGDGVNGYIQNINLSTTTNYVLNNATRLYVTYSQGTETLSYNRLIDGTSSTNQNIMTFAANSSVAQARINQTVASYVGGVDFSSGLGLRAVVRDTATDVRLYNKAIESQRTVSSTSRLNLPQLQFRNGSNYADTGISFSLYGAALTQSQIEGLREQYNIYLMRIGLTAYA